MHENTSKAIAIVTHSHCCGKQNTVHTQQSACACSQCVAPGGGWTMSRCKCWSNYMCLVPYIKTAPHPHASSKCILHSAACHKHCMTSPYRHPMQQQSELLQSVTNNNKLIYMKVGVQSTFAECSTAQPPLHPAKTNAKYQLSEYQSCFPILVFQALHSKALPCKLLRYRLKALIAILLWNPSLPIRCPLTHCTLLHILLK